MADNPFADNPFAVGTGGTVPPATGGAWGGAAAPGAAGAWGGAAPPPPPGPQYAPPVSININSGGGGGGDTAKREAELARREAELARREAELRRLELELRNAPGGARSVKNWPRFCPVIHHDIAGEVPAALQGTVRSAYFSFVGLIVCLLWNFIATLPPVFDESYIDDDSGVKAWLWACIYLFAGVPGAFILWYNRLYNAAQKDSAIGYAMFFLCFLGHMVFVVWAAVAPPLLNSWSMAGWMAAAQVAGNDAGVGIVWFIGAALWSLEAVWSLWTLRRVYGAFRGQGISAKDVQADAALAGVRAAAAAGATRR